MPRRNCGIRPALVLLVAVLTASQTSIGASPPANETGVKGEKSEENPRQVVIERKKIGKANDHYLKAADPLYSRHAKSLAHQYRETAETIARHGGDPRPVLDAAAYFDKEAEPESGKPSKEAVFAREVME